MTERSRRGVVATLGALATGGCLRLGTGDGGTTTRSATETTPSGGDGGGSDADGGDGGSDDGFLPSREEAIGRVEQFAVDTDPTPLGAETGPDADVIAFPPQQGGTTSTNGPDGSTSTSTDLTVAPADGEAFVIGGDTGRSVQVHNVTLDTTATFTPSSDTALDVTEMGLGQYLVPDASSPSLSEPTVLTVAGDGIDRIDGSWNRDGTVFTGQAFARYRVRLLEGETVVGQTGTRVFGSSYLWAAEQSAESLFVTRQPSVDSDWYVSFVLGGFGGDDTVTVERVPDRNVLEVDLGELSSEPGQYEWELRFKPEESTPPLQSYLRLRGSGLVVQ